MDIGDTTDYVVAAAARQHHSSECAEVSAFVAMRVASRISSTIFTFFHASHDALKLVEICKHTRNLPKRKRANENVEKSLFGSVSLCR